MDEERAFLLYIRQHKGIGYGRMMQLITCQWFREVGDGALAANTCVAYLPKRERAAIEHWAGGGDPVFRADMEEPV